MEQAQQRVLAAEKQAAIVARAKASLELEKFRIAAFIEILNNSSTQASLLAGCAVAALSGESIDTVDQDMTSDWLFRITNTLFVLSTACAICSSLWVIFISSNLVSIMRDAALRPNIVLLVKVLEKGVYEVTVVWWFALLSLLVSCLCTAWLNMLSLVNKLVCTAVFFVFGWQALLKQREMVAASSAAGGAGDRWIESPTFRMAARELLGPFSWLCRCWKRTKKAGFEKLAEDGAASSTTVSAASAIVPKLSTGQSTS